MGRPIVDLSGKTFGFIEVNSFSSRDNGANKTYWNCTCAKCGRKLILDNTTIHKNMACGCMKGKTTFKYKNHDKPLLYKKWNHMKSRCENSKDISFPNYGGRGIKMCSEWQDYDKFYEWSMNNGYEEELEIDRIDVNGNYSPDNCRYITRAENRRNLRRTKYYYFENEKLSLAEIAERLGVNYKVLWQQLTRDGINKYNLKETR